jgi:hypothetical protein
MISEHKSQTFKYDIIHYFKVSLIRCPPPDKAWPVLVVQCIQTCNVLRCQAMSAEATKKPGAWWYNLLAWCCVPPSWSVTGRLEETTTQLKSCWTVSRLYITMMMILEGPPTDNITAGPPAGEWNWGIGLRVNMCMILHTENFEDLCWLWFLP